MNNIIEPSVTNFIRSIQPDHEGMLGDIEKEAVSQGVPIIEPEVARLISVLLSLKKPKTILEIGTAVGYSSILMSTYLQSGGKITTIERYAVMQKKAQENIQKMNLQNTITVMEGDATEILPTLTEPFDVIFLDGAKGQYHLFLPHCLRLLHTGGLLIADNILQDGMIAQSRFTIPRRQRTIHKRMRNFLWNITHSSLLDTSLLSIGDGVAICYKKSEGDVPDEAE